MKNKLLMILVVCIVFLPITSCSEIVELDDLAIFSGVAFDKGTEKKYDATIQVILHRQLKVQSQGGSGNVTTNVLVSGDSIIDVSRNFTLIAGRKGFWSHAQVFIIGEELAKSGISDLIDIFERDHEIRKRTYLLVAKGNASDILSAQTAQLETIQAFNISDMIEKYTRNGKVIPVNVNRYGITTSPNNDSAFITGIRVMPEDKESSNNSNRIQLDGTAILKKDQLVGWFDDIETRGLLWILGELKRCIIGIKYPSKDDSVAIEISNSNSKIIPVIQNETVRKIIIEVKCTGNIAQSNSNVKLMEEGTFEEIGEKVKAQIEKEMMQSIKKAQEFNTDVFGFNEIVNNEYPKVFKELKEHWDEVFSALEVELIIEVNISGTGLFIESVED